MTQQFGSPSVEYLVDCDSVPNREGASTVRSHEYVPGFSLIVVIVARDRYSSPQISNVVIPFAAHIKPNQVTRAHILTQMIVPGQRGERAREYGIVSGHCPRPGGRAMCSGLPAGVFDHCFDAALRYAGLNCPHSGQYCSHRCFRGRSQGSNLVCALNRHEGLDSFPRFFGLEGGPSLQNDLQPQRRARRLGPEKIAWKLSEFREIISVVEWRRLTGA